MKVPERDETRNSSFFATRDALLRVQDERELIPPFNGRRGRDGVGLGT